MVVERIIYRLKPEADPGEAAVKKLNEFVERAMKLPIREAEELIAEDRFRKPIRILGSEWVLRPFWRDGRKAPPLFPKKTYKGAKAEELIMASDHHLGSH